MKLREVYGVLHNEDKYPSTRHKIQEILYEFYKPRYVRICIYLKQPKQLNTLISGYQMWGLGRLEKETTPFSYETGQWQCNLPFSSCASLLLWKHSHFLTCTIAFCYDSPFAVSFTAAILLCIQTLILVPQILVLSTFFFKFQTVFRSDLSHTRALSDNHDVNWQNDVSSSALSSRFCTFKSNCLLDIFIGCLRITMSKTELMICTPPLHLPQVFWVVVSGTSDHTAF